MAKIRYPKKDQYCVNRKTVRESLPFSQLYSDGMMRSTTGKRGSETHTWSMTYRIIDTNYETADSAEQQAILQHWYGVLNLFDSDTVLQISVINRTPSKEVLELTTQIPLRGDSFDKYREELNGMMSRKLAAGGKRKVIQEKYLTISTVKKNKEEAERYFNRIKRDLRDNMAKLGSGIGQLGEIERARLLHDIYRQGMEDDFSYSPQEMKRRGHTVKESIAPFTFEPDDTHIKVGNKLARSMVIFNYPQYIEDRIVKDLTDTERNMILTVTLVPIQKQDAIDQCGRVYTNIEGEIARFTRKQVNSKNYNAMIPIKTEEKRDSIIDLRNDLSNRNQSIFFMNLSITMFAEDETELNSATESIIATGRKQQCNIIVNKYLQEDTFNTSMPYGLHFIENWRTMTSESVAAFNPFVARELIQPGGLYYGNHAITGTVIIGNRDMLDNGNAVILGASGKGKSMFAKAEMIQIFLRADDNTDIIVVDPEREFAEICKLFDGANIILSANSEHHVNPMALPDSKLLDTEDKPLPLKAEFLQTIFVQLLGKEEVGAREKSIIDRGLRETYAGYKKGAAPPSLPDFYAKLKAMPEPEAAQLALGLEMFIEGNLNAFAHQTNIDATNRFTVYDINELGAGLRDVGMSIMLDAIFSKVAENRALGKKTVIYVDEFWIMMKHPQSAEYMQAMWRRFRKYGANVNGLSQNLQDLMGSEEGRTIVKNASIAVMLGQQTNDVVRLQEAYGLSNTQCVYINDTPPGHGLLKFGDTYIPFENEFDKSLSLYRAMTTNQLELKAFRAEEAI